MFNIVRDILHNKTGEYLTDAEAMNEYSLYMVQRWISMFSNQPIEFLNSSVNIVYGALDNEESYKFLLTVLPKYKYKRIEYIKVGVKPKKKKEDEEVSINIEENREKLDRSVEFVFGKGV